MGHHIMTPKRGIAMVLNAFNFPIWGMLEKIAVNLLAGMPRRGEAGQTDLLPGPGHGRGYHRFRDFAGRRIADRLRRRRGHPGRRGQQDVVTFTGSAYVGRMLKASPSIINNSVPFNMEADSLNAAVLGPDAVPGTPEFDLFIKEVRKEITLKAGQRCTAIRRVLIPENLVEDVQLALAKQLKQTVLGDPNNETVRMGALVSRDQVEEVAQPHPATDQRQRDRLRRPGELRGGGRRQGERRIPGPGGPVQR